MLILLFYVMKTGSGYVRSDGTVVIFLQTASQARRIYATVLNVRTNADGYKEQGVTFPDGDMQYRLICDTYNEIGLSPTDVTYVEAHGTGTIVGDAQEVNSITDFFCSERRDAPLLIGSVKSNMGHAEAASGLCSIVKILLAMETGVIPGNLHFETPRSNLHGIIDGRLKVVDRNTQWAGGIVGVNSFGFGGANAHVILKSNEKQKLPTSNHTFPRLAIVSGRTNDAINLLLNEIDENKNDVELLNMINEIHVKNIPLHYFRGYAVVGDTIETIREVTENIDEKRSIWYIYSGVGSQWTNMGKDLMELDVFRKSIERSADVLKPKGIDLIALLTNSGENTFDDVLNSFVAIICVQIGLTDVLKHLGIKPDGIVGHSYGEICSAYADGCLTAEETVLVAYWNGYCASTTPLEKAMMASVGLSLDEMKVSMTHFATFRLNFFYYFHFI